MRRRRLSLASWLATIAIAGSLAACAPVPDVTLTLTLDNADPLVVAATRAVLEKRFHEFRPSPFATTRSTIDGPRIVFVFHRGSPDQATLAKLFGARGVLRAEPVDAPGPVWFTDADVVDVRMGRSDSGPFVAMTLSEEAGERLVRLTTQNVGRTVRTTLDGRVLLQARVNGVFGRRFQITGGDELVTADDRAVFHALVSHGSLPARVVEASFEPETAAAR